MLVLKCTTQLHADCAFGIPAKAKEEATDVAKVKKSTKPPSRKRYEEEHRTRSARLDREDNELLDSLLEGTGCSFADFIKDALGREKSMVEKRVETQALKQIHPAIEHRLRCLEDLVQQILGLAVDTDEYPPYCPHCDGQKMFQAEGRETESTITHPWVLTWKCSKCGFFIDTYKRIDPQL